MRRMLNSIKWLIKKINRLVYSIGMYYHLIGTIEITKRCSLLVRTAAEFYHLHEIFPSFG